MSLESEFQKVYEDNIILIRAKVAQASKILNEAISIAEEHGIPFDSNISEIGQQYTPESFHKKWNSLDDEKLAELGLYIYVSEYNTGWENSAIC